ncbi:adiponectin receptor [Angomonas deanei]|uniref:Haemolysin-III related, putative n=1 Tax=Angomonas deanei TaxID=59799 RepID=A0A7G2C1R3_9TRYP|nr:adiponectin receptor [Angomonas deanei]CAD2213151.1 Haemolysin-III related, putative [Angomonas deanei]|eukprot:EPY43584.1 adiponectin receptor [Angomonas deanei]
MLGGSSVYHTLAAHHCERVHNFALSLDYFGITCMIIGSFYPPVFYMFSCMKLVRFLYLSAVTVLGAIGLIGPFFSFFNDPKFFWMRISLHVALTSIGVLPAVHIMFGFPANRNTQPLYQGLLLMLLIYFVGMVIYIFKVPERWFPGRFDLVLGSHQLWHFFVLAAAVTHYFTCIGAFQLWRVTGDAGGDCA